MENVIRVNISLAAMNELKEAVDKYFADDFKAWAFRDKKEAFTALTKAIHVVLEERDSAISEFIEKQNLERGTVILDAVVPAYLDKAIQIQKKILDSYSSSY